MDLKEKKTLQDIEYDLYDEHGTKVTGPHGCWYLCDNGFHRWRVLQVRLFGRLVARADCVAQMGVDVCMWGWGGVCVGGGGICGQSVRSRVLLSPNNLSGHNGLSRCAKMLNAYATFGARVSHILITPQSMTVHLCARGCVTVYGGASGGQQTFGVLKARFRCLKVGLQLQTMGRVANVFFTCCILHNELLEADGLASASLRIDCDCPSSHHHIHR